MAPEDYQRQSTTSILPFIPCNQRFKRDSNGKCEMGLHGTLAGHFATKTQKKWQSVKTEPAAEAFE